MHQIPGLLILAVWDGFIAGVKGLGAKDCRRGGGVSSLVDTGHCCCHGKNGLSFSLLFKSNEKT